MKNSELHWERNPSSKNKQRIPFQVIFHLLNKVFYNCKINIFICFNLVAKSTFTFCLPFQFYFANYFHWVDRLFCRDTFETQSNGSENDRHLSKLHLGLFAQSLHSSTGFCNDRSHFSLGKWPPSSLL